MGRGRRPNLALEPTRALQTQRAFRQRKAEHLANLEQSVKALTDENAKLRRMLHLDPASPRLSSNAQAEASGSGSASPSSSAAGTAARRATPGVEGKAERMCEGCAPVHEANRQLGVAAAQVEAQMRGLQQTLKALRSVLAQHNIALPSPLGLAQDEPPPLHPPQPARQTKRARVEGAPPQLPPLYAPDIDHHSGGYTPSGVHMTSHYYAAPSPHEAYRRSTHTSTSTSAAGATGTPGSAWHTPSPSAILSAPTPPSASFSPRHSYAAYPSPNPTSTSAYPHAASAEEAYYRRLPTRQNSGSTSTSNSASGTNSANSNGTGGRPQLPQLASLSPARHSPSLPWSQLQAPQAPQAASPASSKRHYDPPQPPATAAPDRAPAKCCPAPSASATTSTTGGSTTTSASGSGSDGRTEGRSWEGPPPLGVSFDMRGAGAGASPSSAENGGAKATRAEGEDDCCFGLVKCDSQGRIVI